MRTERTLEAYALAGEHRRDWYAVANQEIHSWIGNDWCSKPFEFVVDILALTSPRVNVSRNVRITHHFLRFGTLPHDVVTSVRTSVDHYLATGEIRGPKTSAFARAIKGDAKAIVLDTWMARAFNVPNKAWGVKGTREKAEKRILKLSRSLGWSPSEVQACIWAAAYEKKFSTKAPYLVVK
jgi:hypothetical protein